MSWPTLRGSGKTTWVLSNFTPKDIRVSCLKGIPACHCTSCWRWPERTILSQWQQLAPLWVLSPHHQLWWDHQVEPRWCSGLPCHNPAHSVSFWLRILWYFGPQLEGSSRLSSFELPWSQIRGTVTQRRSHLNRVYSHTRTTLLIPKETMYEVRKLIPLIVMGLATEFYWGKNEDQMYPISPNLAKKLKLTLPQRCR